MVNFSFKGKRATDHTGKVFGCWKVVRMLPSTSEARCLARCERCGEELRWRVQQLMGKHDGKIPECTQELEGHSRKMREAYIRRVMG